jgi:glycosyltransferase involved in cell wall biosynthesis
MAPAAGPRAEHGVTSPEIALAPGRLSIVAICSSYPPVLGGTEVEVQRVCAALLERGYRVEVLCRGGAPMPAGRRWVDAEGVPVRMFGGRWPAAIRDYAYAIGVAWTLWRRRRTYQIAYFVMGGVQLALALPVARLARKRIFMKFSGSNTVAPLTASALGRFELRALRRWAEQVLVLNPGMMEEAQAAGFPRSQLGWMPNPVDVDLFAPAGGDLKMELRRRLGVAPDAFLIVYVGRLAPEKQLPLLVEAFARVRRACPAASLALVGDGPRRHELQSLAARLGLEDEVRFAGAVSSSGVREWLGAADVFALVSSLEGFPCSLSEAMAAGLPSVVSDIPGNTQLVRDGVHGLVTRCGEAASIGEALALLAADPEKRRAFGAAARDLILREYSTGIVMDRYERLFGNQAGAVCSIARKLEEPRASQ